MDISINKGNDSAQEVLEKIHRFVELANNAIDEVETCQHIKSQLRVTDILVKLAMDNNATDVIYGDSAKKLAIIGNGQETIAKLVRLYFNDALKAQEVPICNCHDYCECRIPDNENLSLVIRFLTYKGDYIHVRLNIMNDDNGLLKTLTLTCEELGVITHTMFDLESLARQYKVIDNSKALAGSDDEVLGKRHYFLSINRKLKAVPTIHYTELDDKPLSCLIEQR